MYLRKFVFLLLSTVMGLLISYGISFYGVHFFEDHSKSAVVESLTGQEWASVEINGAYVILSGDAPDENSRFAAIEAINTTIHPSRLIDQSHVISTVDIEPPKFVVEILRNNNNISLIGLVPFDVGREKIEDALIRFNTEQNVTDLLESVQFSPPDNWGPALDYALTVLKNTPKSKLRVTPGHVEVTAVVETGQEKLKLEKNIRDDAPKDILLSVNISAPRPVFSPFEFELNFDNKIVRLEKCHATDIKQSDEISKAVNILSSSAKITCQLGLGAPSDKWHRAIAEGIKGLKEMSGGQLLIQNTDIKITSPKGMDEILYNQTLSNIKRQLPEGYSVTGELLKADISNIGDPNTPILDFSAKLDKSGKLAISGYLPSVEIKTIIVNLATAEFGSDQVIDTTKTASTLPPGWQSAAIFGINSLDGLHSGVFFMDPTTIRIKGSTSDTSYQSIIRNEFNEIETFTDLSLSISISDPLPIKKLSLAPVDCVDNINKTLTEKQIEFNSNSAKLTDEGLKTIATIANSLTICKTASVEVEGYTDNQGSENDNLMLSQNRAEAVAKILQNSDGMLLKISAQGYGEANPVADNETKEGRAKNRRIQFKLIEE